MINSKREMNKSLIPFLVLIFLLIPMHILMKLTFSDDVTYAQTYQEFISRGENIFDIGIHYYKTWSTRVIVEPIAILMVMNKFLWNLFNIGAFLLIGLSFSYLYPGKNKTFINTIICGLLLLYPFGDLGAAGWSACTVGYFWTTASIAYIATALKKVYFDRKFKWFEYITYGCATLFAANHEQANAFLIAMLLCFGGYAIYTKKKCGILYFLFAITVAEFVFIMTAPGNSYRITRAIEDSMPQFINYNIFQKLYMSYSYTMNYFIVRFNPIYLTFAAILCGLVFLDTKVWWKRLISVIPITYSILAAINPWDKLSLLFHEQFMLEELVTSRRNYLPFFLSILILLSILISLYFILKASKEYIIVIIVLGIGFATRLAMGFSPTVYQSHQRTAIFLYFSFIFVIGFLISLKEEKFDQKVFSIVFSGFSIMAFINLLLNIESNGGIIPKYF